MRPATTALAAVLLLAGACSDSADGEASGGDADVAAPDTVGDAPVSPDADVTTPGDADMADGDVPDDGGESFDVDAGDADVDADDPEPRICSFDCWPTVLCSEGEVTATPGGFWSGPCGEEPDSCPSPSQTHTCAEGCGLETRCMESSYCADGGDCDLAARCAESQPGRVGDPCETDADCEWPCAPLSGPLYQWCDTGADPATCVAIDPPTGPDDFGKGCQLDPAAFDAAVPAGLSKRSFLDGQGGCTTGLCVVERDGDCAYQACTMPCTGDHDCPHEWRCDGLFPVGGGGETKVCSPVTLFDPGPGPGCYK